MKSLFLAFITLLCPLSFATSTEGLNPQRERLFHCVNFGEPELAEELFIVESRLGRTTFFEVEVPYLDGNEEKTFFRKLNLISKYDGRVLLYTTGNYRVKIDRVFPIEKKYKAFVRLPYFDVHSLDWFCKDY